MNYTCFSQLEEGTYTSAEAETEQTFMEKVLSAVFSETEDVLLERINDKMQPQFICCNAAERSLSVSFTAQEWMLNPNGTLHGGMLSTAVDIVMSVFARFLLKKRTVVTVQLSMNFLRTIQKGESFTVTVTADHAGRRSVMMHATVFGQSGKPATTATAVLM